MYLLANQALAVSSTCLLVAADGVALLLPQAPLASHFLFQRLGLGLVLGGSLRLGDQVRLLVPERLDLRGRTRGANGWQV